MHFGTEFTPALRAKADQCRTDLQVGLLPAFSECLAKAGGDYEHAMAMFTPFLMVQDWPRGAYASHLATAVAEVHRLTHGKETSDDGNS